MNVSVLLLIILFLLMATIGGKRGIKSFFTLVINFVILFIMLGLMAVGIDPIKVTILGCIFISCTTLFYINGLNKKTVASLVSVISAVLLTLAITYKVGIDAKIQGFSIEQSENVAFLSMDTRLNLSKVGICQIIFGLLGAIIDVSISISSSMNEIFRNNQSITKSALLKSGISVGKDILGTMTNTLLFAYVGGFLALIIWFNKLNYSIPDILNGKVFVSEVFQVLCGGIGIVLVIPISAFVMSILLFLGSATHKKGSQSKSG